MTVNVIFFAFLSSNRVMSDVTVELKAVETFDLVQHKRNAIGMYNIYVCSEKLNLGTLIDLYFRYKRPLKRFI